MSAIWWDACQQQRRQNCISLRDCNKQSYVMRSKRAHRRESTIGSARNQCRHRAFARGGLVAVGCSTHSRSAPCLLAGTSARSLACPNCPRLFAETRLEHAPQPRRARRERRLCVLRAEWQPRLLKNYSKTTRKLCGPYAHSRPASPRIQSPRRRLAWTVWYARITFRIHTHHKHSSQIPAVAAVCGVYAGRKCAYGPHGFRVEIA